MAYTIFQTDTTITATDFDNNFKDVAQGNYIPRGGVSLTATDSVYDLGSTAYKWLDVHTQNIEIQSDVKVGKCINMIAETTLTESATSIEFTGLNGDDDEIYEINYHIYGYGTTSVFMYLNGDSAANYGRNMIYLLTTTVNSQSYNSLSNIYLGYHGEITTTALNVRGNGYIRAASGRLRLSLWEWVASAGGTYIDQSTKLAFVWNNTTDTLTSIKLTGNFATNTNVQLWAVR